MRLRHRETRPPGHGRSSSLSETDANGVLGAGGWAVEIGQMHEDGATCAVTAVITSGGEDVADAIGDAAARLWASFTGVPGCRIEWTQWPDEPQAP